MKKPAWKSIVATLSEKDEPSAYSEKLPASALHGAQETIEQEVVQEMGAALKRAGEKIEEALHELEQLDARLETIQNPERRRRLVETFNETRREALEARRNYIIQREAIGLFRHESVLEEYPIPGKRSSPVGPHGEDGTVEDLTDCPD